MLCLLFYGYRTYNYYINGDLVIILVSYYCLVMCIQYFIFGKNDYIMNFATDITTAVTAYIIVYLVFVI